MKNVIIKTPGSGRHFWAVIKVDRATILQCRLNTYPNKTGRQMVSGFWYKGDIDTVCPYGKIGTPRNGRIRGRVVAKLTERTAQKLLR